MKYRLMDLLACPICKRFPLKLIVLEEKKRDEGVKPPKNTCEEYCGYKRIWVRELPEKPCVECYSVEVVEGVLICPECNRWYPIMEEIPHMLPDELRNEREDKEFLRKHKDRLPREVLDHGKPFNLST